MTGYKMHLIWILLVATGVAAFGCSDADPSLSVGGDNGAPDWTERRRRMNITAGVDGESRDITVDELVHGEFDPQVNMPDDKGIRADCELLLLDPPEDGGTAPSNCTFPTDVLSPGTVKSCRQTACELQLRLCVANRLMELADVPQFDREIGNFTVGPQDRAAQAGLHEAAMDVARETMILAAGSLETALHDPSGKLCVPGNGVDALEGLYLGAPGPTNGEVIGHAMAEAYYLMRDAAEKAVSDNLALGDEAFAVESSQTRAARVAYTAPVLSRGHAAQIAIGNDPTLDLSTGQTALPSLGNQPLFTRERSESASFRMALSLFRDAAPSPREILATDSVSLDALITDGTPEGTLSKRLAERYDTALPTNADDFIEHFGTSREDLREAREVLIEELIGFDRNLDQKLVENFDYVSGPLANVRYAATATPPSTPPGRWAALALQGHPDEAVTSRVTETSFAGSPKLDGDYARRSMANAVDYALSAANELMANNVNELSDATIGSFASLLSEADERPARLEYILKPDGSLVLRVLGGSLANVFFVKGTSGLECALKGTVEGQPCDLEEHSVKRSEGSDFALGSASRLGFDGGVEDSATDSSPAVGETAIFHAIFETDVDLGNRDLLGSVPVTNPNVWQVPELSAAIPANPWAAELVRASLAPADDDPTEPIINCAGVDTTQAIPLENELSEDGSGVESSWRTYLALAKQAADEADRIGQDLIEQGLRMDLRAEGALDVLAETCGTNIDLDWTRVNLDSDGDGAVDLVDGPCSTGCAEGRVCHQGYCVADPIEGLLASAGSDDANLSRLRACVADAEVIPFVSLGSDDLCVWRSRSNPNDICQGSHPGFECPFRLSRTLEASSTHASCEEIPEGMVPNDSDIEFVSVHPLNLFQSDGPGTSSGPQRRAQLCDALRTMREPGGGGWSQAFRKSAAWLLIDEGNELSASNLYASGAALNVTYRAGGFSSLSIGKKNWFVDMGDLERGPNIGRWPCRVSATIPSQSPMAERCAEHGGVGFWCQEGNVDCADPGQRFAFSSRMVNAVVAAKLISGATLEGSAIGFHHVDPLRLESCGGVQMRSLYTGLGGSDFATERCEGVDDDGWDPGNLTFEYHFRSGPYILDVSSWPWLSEPPTIVSYGDHVQRQDSVVGPTMQGLAYRATSITSGFQGRPSSPFGGFRLHEVLRSASAEAAILGRWHDADATFGYGTRTDDYRMANLEECNPLVPSSITNGSVRDAAEMLCEVPLNGSVGTASCGQPPSVSTAQDLPVLVDFLECAADTFEQSGERMVFAGMPLDVASAVQSGDSFAVNPGAGGVYGDALSGVRLALRDIPQLQLTVASKLDQFAAAMRGTEARLRSIGISDQLSTMRLASTISSQAAACGTAIARGASGLGAIGGDIAAGAITCVNSAVQIGLAFAQAGLEAEQGDSQRQEVVATIMRDLLTAVEQMESATLALKTAQEKIDAGLTAVESARRKAKRAVSRALFADSDASGAVYPVNTVMRRQSNTLAIRYREAHRRALMMASLARLALEQRLGVRLEELSDMATSGGLSLVEDPAEWASDLCTMSGVDFGSLRDGRTVHDSYEDEFVGDYVRRLEGVVETYRLDLPFSDGRDRSVVSVRDDIMAVNDEGAECTEAEAQRNLLYDGSRFLLGSPIDAAAELPIGWSVAGCEAVSLETGEEPVVVDCVSLIPLAEGMVPQGTPEEPSVPGGHRLVFGNHESAAAAAGDETDVTRTSLRNETSIRQPLDVMPGHTYRVSFYYRPSEFFYRSSDSVASMPIGPSPQELADVEGLGGNSARLPIWGSQSVGDSVTREWFFFTAEPGAQYRLVLRPAPGSGGEQPVDQAIDVAGFMMEDVSRLDVTAASVAADLPPEMLEHSGTRYRLCEDTDGSAFRSRWRRKCERTCVAGGAACSSMVTRCFWETDFALDIARDDSRWLTSGAGYARGNYNYRTEAVAVNFVGTALRDCEGVASGSVCYANGSIPYSIYHDAGFQVRNHVGNIYSAPLNPGRIETARGLAAERYITNPTSGADSALLSGYMRREMQGRPIAGNYRIRVWDEPGVMFDRIEDVQLIIDYRYWTRLN